MDYRKIKLENERSTHVKKRLNRLNSWNFFKVIYRDNIGRLFGFSLLMLLLYVPLFIMFTYGSYTNASIQAGLPLSTMLGFSTGVWQGAETYLDEVISRNNDLTALYMILASLPLSIMLSGGFAVIRDAFWTGNLETVGVFKSIGKGIKANFPYAIVCQLIISVLVYASYKFIVWSLGALTSVLAVIFYLIVCMVAFCAIIYCVTVCSVSVTYKQSLATTLSDSWRLSVLNPFPNIFHMAFAVLPGVLYLIVMNVSALYTLVLVFIMMFGGMFFPFVWHTHMMRTFALFNPVETKKK